MRKRARVIYNPTSGREILKQKMVDILDIFEQAGYETSAYATTAAKDSAKNEAQRAAEEGFELVVAAGGDGTINEVVNGIAPLKKNDRKWRSFLLERLTIMLGRCIFPERIRLKQQDGLQKANDSHGYW